MNGLRAFINKNLVAIVMIPSLIGVHYGWSVLQTNETLIPDHERKTEQPIVSLVKRLAAGKDKSSEQ